MEFKDKIVVVTGAGQGIGESIARNFSDQGAIVCSIDLAGDVYYRGDLRKKESLEEFSQKVIADYGHVDYLINNAPPIMKGLTTATYEDMLQALQVGTIAPFYLTKLFMPYFSSGGVVINISSSRDRMSQEETETYSAAKGGISALTHSMAITLSGRVRVNSISPGWIDTTKGEFSPEDNRQHPAGRIGSPQDISNMVMFLCSDRAGFITGENICIDGGMTKLMIYHGDCGWRLEG